MRRNNFSNNSNQHRGRNYGQRNQNRNTGYGTYRGESDYNDRNLEYGVDENDFDDYNNYSNTRNAYQSENRSDGSRRPLQRGIRNVRNAFERAGEKIRDTWDRFTDRDDDYNDRYENRYTDEHENRYQGNYGQGSSGGYGNFENEYEQEASYRRGTGSQGNQYGRSTYSGRGYNDSRQGGVNNRYGNSGNAGSNRNRRQRFDW